MSSTATTETKVATLDERALGWARDFESALAAGNEAALRELIVEDSYWGDRLAFTWDSRQSWGRDALLERIIPASKTSKPHDFTIAEDRTRPREVDGGTIEVFYDFRTAFGTARALITFVPDDSAAWGMRARVLSTDLATLDIVGDHTDIQRHPKYGWEKKFPGQTYREYQQERSTYADHDPEVLVVGGSQSGISVAAQLERLGIDALVVEKNASTGDSWRNRYDSLALHTKTDMNDTPFTKFPSSMPTYLVKDRWADWLDAYPKIVNLNVWTSTEFVTGKYDEKAQRWVVTVRRADGSERTLRPVHLILCVGGVGGQPHIPELPGLKDFTGTVMHSSQFTSGADWKGKRVLVVGSGTSAHDISYDLVTHGAAEVTMVQRSAIPVVGIDTANLAYGYYFDPTMTQDEADQRFAQGAIYPILTETLRNYTKYTNQTEKDLHDGLTKAGMKLDTGEDETGWLMKFLRYGGGYYLNVGASDAIISGDIKLLPNERIDHYTAKGVALTDGTEKEVDLIVLATGYQNLSKDVERLLGKEVADKVGRLAGFGEDGEIRNRCRVTKQEHLWFMFGGIGDLRSAVPRMSLHLKAQLAGLIPTYVRGDDNEIHEVPTPK